MPTLEYAGLLLLPKVVPASKYIARVAYDLAFKVSCSLFHSKLIQSKSTVHQLLGLVQVMEEVIAKSKQHKAEKSRQKEADLELLDRLDTKYRELMAQGSLQHALLKPGEAKYVQNNYRIVEYTRAYSTAGLSYVC